MSRICHQHCPPGHGGWLSGVAWLACWASAAAAVWLAWQFAGLLALMTAGAAGVAGVLLLGLHGLKRRYAVAYHPAGRHGLAYKPGRAVTRGTSAAALGLTRPEAVPAPSQPATLHWTPVNQQQQQSAAAQRHAVDVHYSDACECRNCRRQRRKQKARRDQTRTGAAGR